MEPVAYDYYYSSSEAVGYGQYPYHSWYLPQLPDIDSGYSNGSDVEFSYKVIMTGIHVTIVQIPMDKVIISNMIEVSKRSSGNEHTIVSIQFFYQYIYSYKIFSKYMYAFYIVSYSS